MTAPVLLSAGDSTPGRLQCVDINLTDPVNTTSPNWQPIQFINSADLNPDDPTMVDATVFGDGGFTGQDKLGATWSATVILNHMIVPGTAAYDQTHNYLESKAVGKFGPANRVQLRFYDFDVNDVAGVLTPRGQAYMGFANFNWPRFGAVGQADARMVSVAFLGKGKLNPIAHPYPATPQAPTVNSIDPSTLAVGGGTPFDIFGSGFTGTTGVTVAGNAVTTFSVRSNNRIIAVAPAHAAGTNLPVVVTNAVGASAAANLATYA